MGVEFAEEYWIEYSRDNGTTWNKWNDMNGVHVSSIAHCVVFFQFKWYIQPMEKKGEKI